MNTVRYVFFFVIMLFGINPGIVHALNSVQITEVMYDRQGTDDGYEWIELYNSGTSAIPIATWFLFENDTNHKLTPLNFADLEPGEYAVIIQNEATFVAEHGGSINRIKSSFSLNNEGESISLRDTAKNDIHQISFEPNIGGGGDGTTYGMVGSTWTMTQQSPGAVNQKGEPIVENEDDDSNDNNDDTNDENDDSRYNDTNSDRVDMEDKSGKKSFEPYYQPYINFPESVIAKNPVRFRIGVFHIEEEKYTKEIDGWYYVNFGDGTFFTTQKRIDITHTYHALGTYILSFEFYGSKLARDLGEDPTVLYHKSIEVLDARVTIDGLNEQGAVMITNNTGDDADVSLWSLQLLGKQYRFPKYSIIKKGSSIVLPPRVLGFSVTHNDLPLLGIFTGLNVLVGRFQPEQMPVATQNSSQHQETNSLKNIDSENDNSKQPISDISLGPNTSFLDEYLEKNPTSKKVEFGNEDIANESSQSHDEQQTPPRADGTQQKVIAGGSLLGILLLVGKYYLQRETKNPS